MTTTVPCADLLIAHFAGKLAVETDASDVHADQENDVPFVLIDSRGQAAWTQGRAVGATHMPTAEIADRAPGEIPPHLPVVTYCWGPGCNGSARAALEFAKLGYQVKEMIGGFEYWAREGYPVENDHGPVVGTKDSLTAPLDLITCDCWTGLVPAMENAAGAPHQTARASVGQTRSRPRRGLGAGRLVENLRGRSWRVCACPSRSSACARTKVTVGRAGLE